jgi:hypothetical protein
MNVISIPVRPDRGFLCVPLIGAAVLLSATFASGATSPEAEALAFTDRYCSSCHNDVDKEGGLDLTTLKYTPGDPANFMTWVKIHDRVQAGEMPPKEKKRPDAAPTASFIKTLAASLSSSEQELLARDGRTTRRRLNRTEYEHAVRDLLQAPWLLIKEQLPEDGEAFKFNKVSNALDVSYVHMDRYMQAADAAMRQVMAVKLIQPETKVTRYYARDDTGMSGTTRTQRFDREKFPLLGNQAQPDVRKSAEGLSRGAPPDAPKLDVPWTVGETDPATREREAVGWTSSNYVTGFDSRWNVFRAPVTGRYRLRFSGYTVWVGPNGDSWTKTGPAGKQKETYRKPMWFRPNYDDIQPGRRYEPITVYAHVAARKRIPGDGCVTFLSFASDRLPRWLYECVGAKGRNARGGLSLDRNRRPAL